MLVKLESGGYINPQYVVSMSPSNGKWRVFTVLEVGDEPNPFIVTVADATAILEACDAAKAN